MAAARAAISPSFQCRRSTCHVPSPTRISSTGMVKRVGRSRGRKRIGAPERARKGSATFRAEVAVAELLGDQPRLDDAQHPDRAADRQREPEDDMDPDRWLEPELDPEGERGDDRAEDQD